MNILSKRYLFFLISFIVIIPGLVLLAVEGWSLSIDFAGGNRMEVVFANKAPLTGDVTEFINSLPGIKDAQVKTVGENDLNIQFAYTDPDAKENITGIEIVNRLMEQFPASGAIDINKLALESVGPTIGQEVTQRAGLAVAIAALGVVLFITFAFRGIKHAVRYGICAIIAMVHDVLVVISLAAVGSFFFGWQIDSLFLTALLTVIGFSVQDKIVVFDRIRENSNIYRKLPFEKLANHSIVQTLQRSINTQLMTSEFMLLALALFGGVTLREFSVILLVGLAMGTYSSIFIAAPILVVWENKEWRNWFRRNKSETA